MHWHYALALRIGTTHWHYALALVLYAYASALRIGTGTTHTHYCLETFKGFLTRALLQR